jgi:hypothetical protein
MNPPSSAAERGFRRAATGRRKRKDSEMEELGTQDTVFRKSSYSGAANPNCVEVGFVTAEVLLRDSKDPDGPVLRFTTDEWKAFLAGVKAGEFDLA